MLCRRGKSSYRRHNPTYEEKTIPASDNGTFTAHIRNRLLNNVLYGLLGPYNNTILGGVINHLVLNINKLFDMLLQNINPEYSEDSTLMESYTNYQILQCLSGNVRRITRH